MSNLARLTAKNMTEKQKICRNAANGIVQPQTVHYLILLMSSFSITLNRNVNPAQTIVQNQHKVSDFYNRLQSDWQYDAGNIHTEYIFTIGSKHRW